MNSFWKEPNMLTEDQHKKLADKITAYLRANDKSKVTAQEAYAQLYPDQVDLMTFVQAWHNVLKGDEWTKEHQAMLDRITPTAPPPTEA